MLKQLTIQNLAVVEHLELNFEGGMTTLTGETGAGKSILIDALSLCLGARAESSLIRPGSDQASIAAIFDLQNLPLVTEWLNEKELNDGSEKAFADGNDRNDGNDRSDGNNGSGDKIPAETILRRTIASDGRSRAYINGHPVPLADLRELGEFLIQYPWPASASSSLET